MRSGLAGQVVVVTVALPLHLGTPHEALHGQVPQHLIGLGSPVQQGVLRRIHEDFKPKCLLLTAVSFSCYSWWEVLLQCR